ncbi:MAG: RNA-binding S4 domain-containing protein [Planctomycetota bacterium]
MSETIRLDQYLKVAGIAETGGQAKMLVRSGEILVNGEVVTQRGRQLKTGDEVTVGDQTFLIEFGEDDAEDDL